MDITETLVPKSDQLNAEDLLTGPRTVTVEKVTKGSAEQPVDIHLIEFPGRPFKPSKTVRRIIVAAWGPEASNYVGRRMTLYRDAAVRFGGLDVGGIRVSHLSHIDKRMVLALTVTRGKRAPFTVDPLRDEPPPTTGKPPTAAAIIDAFKSLGVTLGQLEARIGSKRDRWTAADLASLAALGKSIKAGEILGAAFDEPSDIPDEVIPGNVTSDQIKRVTQALVNDKLDDDASQLDWLAQAVGHPVEAIGQLTAAEADQVIEILTAEPGK